MRSAPLVGLILAGGRGRRMGGADKPLLTLGGRTLLEHVVGRLAPQCQGGLLLSANSDPARFSGFPGPILPDTFPGHPGPLAGILAGLDFLAARSGTEDGHVLSVPGDAPFLPPDLAARLTAAHCTGIALASSSGRDHFTVALWPVRLRADLRSALAERDERRVGAFVDRHQPVRVAWPTTPIDPFLNVNAAEDLAAAEALLRR